LYVDQAGYLYVWHPRLFGWVNRPRENQNMSTDLDHQKELWLDPQVLLWLVQGLMIDVRPVLFKTYSGWASEIHELIDGAGFRTHRHLC
jgi:hypothetical protein